MNAIIIVILLLVPLVIPAHVYASHGTDRASCENDGLYDGRHNPFSQAFLKMCGDIYTDAFIRGCMSVNNTKAICEQATDAQ